MIRNDSSRHETTADPSKNRQDGSRTASKKNVSNIENDKYSEESDFVEQRKMSEKPDTKHTSGHNERKRRKRSVGEYDVVSEEDRRTVKRSSGSRHRKSIDISPSSIRDTLDVHQLSGQSRVQSNAAQHRGEGGSPKHSNTASQDEPAARSRPSNSAKTQISQTATQRSAQPSKSAAPPPPPADVPPSPPPPSPPVAPLSKMDRYFDTTYDPRLDLGEIPAEGMIASVGWDNMLAVIKDKGKKVSS